MAGIATDSKGNLYVAEDLEARACRSSLSSAQIDRPQSLYGEAASVVSESAGGMRASCGR
jgi:hypothetical protein